MIIETEIESSGIIAKDTTLYMNISNYSMTEDSLIIRNSDNTVEGYRYRITFSYVFCGLT